MPRDGRFLVARYVHRPFGSFVTDTDTGAALPFRRLVAGDERDGLLAYDSMSATLPVSLSVAMVAPGSEKATITT